MVKTIVHHLGLGDQIMLNGMVRHFAETDNVAIFVKRCHEESVRFMYKDIADKVELILVDNTNAPEIWSKVKGDVIPLATYGIDDNGWKFMTQGQGSVMTNWAHGVYIKQVSIPSICIQSLRLIEISQKNLQSTKRIIFLFMTTQLETGLLT